MNPATDSENNSSVNNVAAVVAATVEEEAPICAICHMEFDPTNFAILDCSHVFHPNCINIWLPLAPRQNCPLCQRQNVTAHRMVIERRINNAAGNEEFVGVSASSDAALPLAWVAYERELHGSARNPHERAALEGIFQDIRLLAQSQQNQNEQVLERAWARIKRFIRCASIAALTAMLIYFCWIFWSLGAVAVAAAMSGKVILCLHAAILSLIELKPLLSLIVKYLPAFVRHALSRMLSISI